MATSLDAQGSIRSAQRPLERLSSPHNCLLCRRSPFLLRITVIPVHTRSENWLGGTLSVVKQRVCREYSGPSDHLAARQPTQLTQA
jgi:hypothetical protein